MNETITFRNPTIDDGAAIWKVVKDSGVLDLNSAYLYLLLSKDFAETCAVAEMNGEIVGFITGYRPPGRESVIFVWQIGVDASARGKGLGKRLVSYLLRSQGARGASILETTISPSNDASRALFRGIARDLGVPCEVRPCFAASQFPGTGHEDEELFRIGPYDLSQPNQLIEF
ncbi:diaminobutyrate acetyltransferase [Alkalilimnicola ehrlichii]|uniref:L-2,4-diaminobutyric acid acetyltransferase n=1 Tax=Alkalilimnicola ehrlichii TaxID=351052 RepID=A0A3E0X0S5_9GAMM|nr:diaminobutyrate acetyltransferase [Alkalilimnicola ehrlichii]RFA31076.1 diaminobutyrate acetyltransferase [Alkalilimnicola ehrlichii]RFA39034.1 diaminobutyrate acetyltransferase [Alkalilimnicola ehrlichii]